jgi:hypothetical protein
MTRKIGYVILAIVALGLPARLSDHLGTGGAAAVLLIAFLVTLFLVPATSMHRVSGRLREANAPLERLRAEQR